MKRELLVMTSLSITLCVGQAFAHDCEAAPIAPAADDPARAFADARAHTARGEFASARGSYEWLLQRNPDDRDAQFALAQLDAWSGCYERAEQRYRALIIARADDIEARSGLIDLLIWSERTSEARSQLDEALRLAPTAAMLWQRRAVLLARTGQRARAIAAADRAESLAPDDRDIRALRDRLWVNQLRASGRIDFFPHAYPSIYSGDLQLTHYFEKFELNAEAQVLARLGGSDAESVVDGLYSLSAQYHADNGMSAGLGAGFGAPAAAIPRFTARAFGLVPIGSRLSAYLAYGFWSYDNAKMAHIFAPALGYALSDEVRLELRWWSSLLILPRPGAAAVSSWVHSIGPRVIVRAWPRLTLGLGYTYGPQLDQVPATYAFLRLTSHIVHGLADWLVTRELGIQPLIAFERRESETHAVAFVFSAELAVYLRY
jgi:tetratricopeptide (TPR) repeat protein